LLGIDRRPLSARKLLQEREEKRERERERREGGEEA
jgi:hypothetical protein